MESESRTTPPDLQRVELVYHFCRLQLATVHLSLEIFRGHLQRTYEVFCTKSEATWDQYLDDLYPLDWYVAVACLEGNERSWEYLFASRAGRADCLLMDALRGRATRLYPRDEEKQENAVNEFWGHLYVSESENSLPILARYDGQRPLVPWLIRVFQNRHISMLRRPSEVELSEDGRSDPPAMGSNESQWHEPFSQAAHSWLSSLQDNELLILGLRVRYRMSQREVASLLQVHEGTISRRTDALRAQCLQTISAQLVEQGWTGDDLSDLIRTEMQNVLLDNPHLSVDNLARILASQGRSLPR